MNKTQKISWLVYFLHYIISIKNYLEIILLEIISLNIFCYASRYFHQRQFSEDIFTGIILTGHRFLKRPVVSYVYANRYVCYTAVIEIRSYRYTS